MKARLLILGMLYSRELHPGEMKRRLRAAMVDCYSDVDVCTLYYAVRRLEKDKSIEAIAQERVARGGERTIHRTTETGREAFQDKTCRPMAADGPVSQMLYGAALFLRHVEPGRLAELVRARIARVDVLIAELAPLRAQMAPRLSGGAEHLFSHVEQQRQLDRAWVSALLTDVETGKIQERPPGSIAAS